MDIPRISPLKKSTEPFQLWKPINPSYGPWWRAEFSSGREHVVALLQPDMDRRSWFWSVRFSPYTPTPRTIAKNPKIKALLAWRTGGRVATLEEAKRVALEAVRRGRPKD